MLGGLTANEAAGFELVTAGENVLIPVNDCIWYEHERVFLQQICLLRARTLVSYPVLQRRQTLVPHPFYLQRTVF